MFDGALKEAYLLMTDGLTRFVVSPGFKSIKRTDLEGDQLRSVEIGLDLDMGIDTYLSHLGTSQARSQSITRSTRLADRRVSFMHLIQEDPPNSWSAKVSPPSTTAKMIRESASELDVAPHAAE